MRQKSKLLALFFFRSVIFSLRGFIGFADVFLFSLPSGFLGLFPFLPLHESMPIGLNYGLTTFITVSSESPIVILDLFVALGALISESGLRQL